MQLNQKEIQISIFDCVRVECHLLCPRIERFGGIVHLTAQTEHKNLMQKLNIISFEPFSISYLHML